MNNLSDFRIETNKLSKKATRAVKAGISNQMCSWAVQNGRLIRDRQERAYLVDDQGTAIPLADDSLALQAALRNAGLNASEAAYKWVWSDLRAEAAIRGPIVPIMRWAGHEGTTIRVSCGPRAYVECDGSGLVKRVNGEAGVIFGADTTLPEWDCTAMPIHPEDLNAFRPYLATPVEVSSYSDAVQRTLLLAYYCGLVAGLRPLLILGIIGQKDSGKTVLARSILRAILGSDANVIALPEKAKDFYVLAAGQPLLCLDNLDEPADARWLPDAMATVATGGAWKGRKLFTDAGIHSSELDAALMLTSRTAVWARADIAERTLPIFPQAFADDQRQPDSFLTEELMAGRSGVLVWLIETAHKLLAWLPQAPVGLPARFLDFGRLVWAYCAATGQPDAAVPILEALRKAQALSIADADPLLAAILEFGPQVTMTNLTPRDLVRALTAAGADLPLFGGGKAIARKLRELKGTLLQAGWHLDEHKSGSATVFTLSM